MQSPNGPVHSLRELDGRSDLIFKRIGDQSASKLDIAHAMGYRNLHGTSYELIADGIEYGLFNKADGDQLKLSTLALDLQAPRGDAKRIKALQKAASIPPMFQKLGASYPDGLADDADLEKSLKSMGLNPNKISAAIRAYRGTIEFLNEEIIASTSESSVKQDSQGPISLEVIKSDKPGSIEKNDSPAFSPPKQREEGEIAWKIADNFIQIGYNGQITRKALQRLIRNLQVNMGDYPSAGNKEEETTLKITDNSIQISYLGPVTQRILQRLVKYLQVHMDEYPD